MASDIGNLEPRNNSGLLHVVLIGFHHKKGCVVEYAYPPLSSSAAGDENVSSLPEEWKYLPSLAMPDGAHNFEEDVVYFHLPPRLSTDEDRRNDGGTVYCVAYCRQVDAGLLSQRDEQVTRGTVQKSVVILSRVPAFGLIHTKLQLPLIANAFLENFSRKETLEELYNQINISLNISDESQLLFGLSPRSLLEEFKHKLLVIFKLILLEKRVVFYTTPASQLVGGILAILSLFPRMIEIGLSDCTNFSPACEVSDAPISESSSGQSADASSRSDSTNNSFGTDADSFEIVQALGYSDTHSKRVESSEEIVIASLRQDEAVSQPPVTGQTISRAGNMMTKVAGKLGFLGLRSLERSEAGEGSGNLERPADYTISQLDPEDDDDESEMMKLGNARLHMEVESPERQPVKPFETESVSQQKQPKLIKIPPPAFKPDEYGFPLSIFTNGHLCLPYVSLQHHDLIQQSSQNGFVVGATNILFQTKKELCDVVVDIENSEIIFNDPSLQRVLSLSAADLRFAEHIVTNNLQHESEDYFNVAAEWKGGDEWLRSLFAEYLHRMLCVASNDHIDRRKVQDFNETFISAWKDTKNFNIWKYGKHKQLESSECQHLFHGQFSISDVRLRLHHRLQNSEQGRKIEGAISNANDTIVNTGRYIGSAFGSAKSSLTSWLSSKMQTNKN